MLAMEIIPIAGSIAPAVIAFFVAWLLTRGGALVVVLLLHPGPVAVWHFGFSA